MREIKFRAWGRIDKKMYPVAFPSWNGVVEGKIDLVNHEVVEIEQDGDDTPVLMQFTGLFDVEGKEVYEGDVVVLPYAEKFSGKAASVIFKEGSFEFDRHMHGAEFRCAATNGNIKVIGNIYENPELLEG